MGATIDLTYQVNDNQIFKMDLTSTANKQYIGFAQPGTQDSDPDWKIYRLDLNGSGDPIGKGFPNANPSYTFKWSLRTSYTYS
jgi:hypothetical protein